MNAPRNIGRFSATIDRTNGFFLSAYLIEVVLVRSAAGCGSFAMDMALEMNCGCGSFAMDTAVE
jgi:hypothetical protein